MKPLSVKQKEFLYGEVAFGRFRWIAKPFYDALMGLELSFHRLGDLFHPRDKSDLSDLTIIIKTFERPYAVKRLVKSIQRRYPDIKIMVVDDSKNPGNLQGVEQVNLPYDTGISASRNEALDRLTTPYFLLLDDDFVFSHRQNLGELMDTMRRHLDIDILGGRCIDLPLYIVHSFQNMSVFSTNSEPKTPIGTKFDGHSVVDKVQNFFVGRTETIKKVKWKPELKINEHTEFFTRARGELTTVFHSRMKILHAKTPFDIAYLQKRFRR